MNTPQLKVPLSKPCSETWEKVLPAGQGKFCMGCRKTAYLFIVIMLALLTPVMAQTAAGSIKSPVSKQQSEASETGFVRDGKLYLNGTVLDAVNDSPIAGARVKLQIMMGGGMNGSGYYYLDYNYGKDTDIQVETDRLGRFELAIPAVELGNGNYALVVQAENYQGYQEMIHHLDLNQPEQTKMLYLKSIELAIISDAQYYSSHVVDKTGCSFSSRSSRYYHDKKRNVRLPRTRAGILLIMVTHPFWKLKHKIASKIHYAFYRY